VGYYPGGVMITSQELTNLTRAHYDARYLTFNRLRQEATLLRADGVVGVRLEMETQLEFEGRITFKAVGTAVRRTGVAKSIPPTTNPFLSNLNGQDHWALRQAGMKPLGFVFGNCSWYQVGSWRNQMYQMGSFYSRELTDYTQAVYTARELAMERLEAEAKSLRATGVVGVFVEPSFELEEREDGSGTKRFDVIASFTMYGTAIGYETGPANPSNVTFNVPLR
jgi:uncharacterized protein YbjQ (UPF0145 family)